MITRNVTKFLIESAPSQTQQFLNDRCIGADESRFMHPILSRSPWQLYASNQVYTQASSSYNSNFLNNTIFKNLKLLQFLGSW